MDNKKKISIILSILMILSVIISAFALNGSNKSNNTGEYDYSLGLDKYGYFKNVKALNYVDLYDYSKIVIPASEAYCTDEDVQRELDYIIEERTTDIPDTSDPDRVIEDGDKISIDYTGYIDGVAFEGGSTNGNGADVVVGTTSYIDNFIDQLKGHKIGDSFKVYVSFPEEYGSEELNGKEAVFDVTINHFYKQEVPELTDAFVEENLGAYAKTVEELKTYIRDELSRSKQVNYSWNEIFKNSTVNDYPQEMIDYENSYSKEYVAQLAANYKTTVEELLADAGYASVDEYIEDMADSTKDTVADYVIVQAICEKEKIKLQSVDLSEYFEKQYGTSDYSGYAQVYGEPYLKFVALSDYAIDAVLEKVTID